MMDLDEIKTELGERINRLKYYNDSHSNRDWIEWLEKIEESVKDIDEHLHDDCLSQDAIDEMEKERDEYHDQLKKVQKDLTAFAARIV